MVRQIQGDLETPVSAYWKLAHDAPASFLLESVTGGEHVGRFSFIGVPTSVESLPVGSLSCPLQWLEDLVGDRPPVGSGLPHFFGGVLAAISYDVARSIEPIGPGPTDSLNLPQVVAQIVDDFVVFDHVRNVVFVIVSRLRTDVPPESRMASLIDRLRAPLPPILSHPESLDEPRFATDKAAFCKSVEGIVDEILSGECIQVVPSVRARVSYSGEPLTLYRSLRSINPSPYMFLLRFGEFDVVGASPELLVSLDGTEAKVRPIAGTRRRGADAAEDELLAADLLADEKEISEHVMLVDLGRNDLGKVCRPGSVGVASFMKVERYSHVMHIVSEIRGTVNSVSTIKDLITACFPAGTVSGAPKFRAMSIIDAVEPERRGLYGGAVGFLWRTGAVDLCIAIRTIVLKDGEAIVQAGAGIVADSKPESEWEECLAKARASLHAIDLAKRGFESL